MGVRNFIEDKLLTTSGYRDSCALDDALSLPEVTQHILDELVKRRLLAYEDRHHMRRVELTHNVLIPVIKASRETRLMREALAQTELRERLTQEEKERQKRELETTQRLARTEAERAKEAEKYAAEQKEAAEKLRQATQAAQQALIARFFRTIGVSNEKIPTRDESEALWELAQLDRDNAAVRTNLLNRWFGTADAFIRGEARGGEGFRVATGLNVEYHRLLAIGDALAAK